MRTLPRVLALSAVSVLALTGCVRVEMNVTLAEDDTASGDFIFAVSQELLEIAGEDSIEEMLGAEETIPGGTTERYESEDEDGDGSPDFVGTQTTFADLPLDQFDAAGEGLRIARDGDDFVVSGAADDLTDQTGGEELPDTATATLSITFPGAVSESDTNGEIDGNTVTWNLLEHSGEVEARGSASADGGFPLWIILVLAAIIGIGAGIAGVLIVSGRRKATDESQVGEGNTFVAGAPVGDPIDAPPYVAPGTDAGTAPEPAVNGVPADASAFPETTETGETAETTDPATSPVDEGAAPASETVDPQIVETTDAPDQTPGPQADGPHEDPQRP